MRKWGPAVALMVGLGALLVYSQCGAPEAGPGYEGKSVVDLWPIAEDVLGDVPPQTPWFRESLSTLDYENLGEKARVMLDQAAAPGDFTKHVDPMAVKQIEWEIAGKADGKWTPLLTHLRGRLALARALLSAGKRQEGFAMLMLLLDESQRCLATPRTVEQWEEAHAARLFVLEGVTNCFLAEGKSAAPLMFNNLPVARHREGLGVALVHNFRDIVLPRIAEASQLDRASSAAGFALYEKQEDREAKEQLISAMLRGHPRAFSPEQTVQAGAESLRALRAAITGPWAKTREVLDLVATTQKFWDDFDALLALEQVQAIEKAKDLGARAKSLENPVGLALLHNERKSWSGMVQSAYVADAKESVFRYMLARAAGEINVIFQDPLTGGPLKVVDGEAVFASEGDDDYPFIAALARTPIPASLQGVGND